jgi:hypothetical protein
MEVRKVIVLEVTVGLPSPMVAFFASDLTDRIVLDTMALAMIWCGLVHLFKESRGLYPSPLINLLIRDGEVY